MLLCTIKLVYCRVFLYKIDRFPEIIYKLRFSNWIAWPKYFSFRASACAKTGVQKIWNILIKHQQVSIMRALKSIPISSTLTCSKVAMYWTVTLWLYVSYLFLGKSKTCWCAFRVYCPNTCWRLECWMDL